MAKVVVRGNKADGRRAALLAESEVSRYSILREAKPS